MDSILVKLMDSNGPANSTLFVLGATGCGKTTLIANELLKRNRFVIVDVKEEYNPSFFGNDAATQPTICKSIEEFTKTLNSGKNRIIFRLPPATTDDEEVINLICFQLLQFQNSNKTHEITMAMDELNRFVLPMSCPSGLQEIIQRGRSYNIKKVFGAQWFNQIPTWCRDSFSEIWTFAHREPRGLQMLQVFGFDPTEVAKLEQYAVLHMSQRGIKHIKLTAVGK